MKRSADLEPDGEEQSISRRLKGRYNTVLEAKKETTPLVHSSDQPLSPLCHVCRHIKFADFLWMNENREFKPYPEWRGYTGCINETLAHFHKGRPKLGSVPDVLSRAGSCAFCSIVSDRLQKLSDLDSIQSLTCYLQAVQFCTDSTLRDQALSRPEDTDTSKTTRTSYAFEPRLPGLQNFWDRTTTRMAVVVQESRDDMWMNNWSYTGATVIEFQPCTTPVPTVLDSLETTRPIPLYGGRLLNPNGVDPELLRFWLDRCEREHRSECASVSLAPRLDSVTGLLFIDVVDNYIVEGCSTSRFVALSYVWGTTNTVLLTRENYPKLAMKGALQDLALPATIRDAITVTRRLGIRFLWADALCIQQDNEAHKESQIAQMASVYVSALLTIVAAAGDHADAGLSRVSTPWDHKVEVINVPGVSLIPVLDFFDDFAPGQLSYSRWYSRAWTMQEHLLSTRKLIFSKNQVYWHCPQSKWVEETELEYGCPTGYPGCRFGWVNHENDAFGTGLSRTGAASHLTIHRTYRKYDFDISTLIQRHEGATNTVFQPSLYEDLAIRFMNRDLTSESDRLNAFTGILKALSALTGEQFIWGLPEGRFCYALTWVMRNQPRTYASQTFQSGQGGQTSFLLPSWSWIAWKSSRTHDLHFGSAVDTDSYFQDDAKEFSSEVVVYQIDAAGGRRQINDNSSRGTTVSAPQNSRPSHLWKLSPVTMEQCDHEFDRLRDRGLLQFWSSTATVELCRGDPGDSEDTNISGGHFIFPKHFHRRTGQLHLAPQDSRTVTTSNTKCSKHKQSTVVADLVVIGSGVTGYKGDKEWILHALIVEWHGSIAYRIGITTISEYDWVKLENRIWKLVTLG